MNNESMDIDANLVIDRLMNKISELELKNIVLELQLEKVIDECNVKNDVNGGD